MNIDPKPIVRRKLRDEVFDRLRDMISNGDLQPGDTLPSERDLMERFGVGRPAIREAMQALSNVGLLTITHGERARIRQVTARSLIQQVDTAAQVMLATSPSSLDHLKEARVFFERGMVRIAAQRAGEKDVAELRALIDEQRARLGDAVGFINADMRFHNRLAALSGNPLFEGFSDAMLAWLKQYHGDMLIWSGREPLTLGEHEEILRQVELHDADAAERAMVLHLERSQTSYASSNGR